jgi:hypothetical protein
MAKDTPELDQDPDSLQEVPSDKTLDNQAPDYVKTPEDELLKSASEDISKDEVPEASQTPKPKRGRKFLIFFIVLLLLGVAGGAYWYLKIYQKPAQPNTQTEQSTDTTTTKQLTYEPQDVAYAFRSKDTLPFNVYLRPVGGGDRSEVQKLKGEAYPTATVHGQNVAFGYDGKLYVSTDGGTTFSNVFHTKAGQYITSVKLSEDGTKLAVAIFVDAGDKSKNFVETMDLTGESASDLFTAKTHNVHLLQWNDDQVVYAGGCNQCDGPTNTPYVYDTKSKKTTELLSSISKATLDNTMVASEDGSKLIYFYGDNPAEELGSTPTAPQTVAVLDISSNKSTTIATVGKAEEKAPNGTNLVRNTLVGFVAGTTTPYYSDAKKLYIYDDGAAHLHYQAAQTIRNVLFVSEENVIASYAKEGFSDFTLANYNTADKKTTTILEGDVNTILFGVTTK